MLKVLLVAAFMAFGALAQSKSITLEEKNTVLLRNEVNDETITKLQHELMDKVIERGSKNYTIYLVLDSPGGSIDSGLMFIEFAKTIPNLETVTVFAASMAAGIVEALPGNRNIISSGILMFHRARGGVQGQFEDGELESELNLYKKIVRGMEQVNADRMNMTLDFYKSRVKDELWIYGQDNLAEKSVDSVVDILCSPELSKSSTIESFLVMGMFKVDVKFSGCPLIRGGKVMNNKMSKVFNDYRKQMKWRSF